MPKELDGTLALAAPASTRAGGNRIVSTIGLESMAQLRLLSLDHNLIDKRKRTSLSVVHNMLGDASLRENPVANMNGYRNSCGAPAAVRAFPGWCCPSCAPRRHVLRPQRRFKS
ncbi:hypothetical protein TcYC6_0029710 [Trypanosoma cruzi]|nr:hypothetical protein TcYC6_0029710 [Trypanosoma cruzi]